jgi:hypothetical protein
VDHDMVHNIVTLPYIDSFLKIGLMAIVNLIPRKTRYQYCMKIARFVKRNLKRFWHVTTSLVIIPPLIIFEKREWFGQ